MKPFPGPDLEWFEDTYQAVDGVYIHVTRHLVATSIDMPSEHHAEVCKAVELMEGALGEPEAVALAALDQGWLSGCQLAQRRLRSVKHVRRSACGRQTK